MVTNHVIALRWYKDYIRAEIATLTTKNPEFLPGYTFKLVGETWIQEAAPPGRQYYYNIIINCKSCAQ